MKEIKYKNFSFNRHSKNLKKDIASVCQFELTFGCDLHCRHCYTDCYNKSTYLKKELTVGQIKYILDKIQRAGVIWLCLTGGDPLIRPDFLDIYSYAKEKGFIITVFTNGYSLTRQMIRSFKEKSPFVLEITVNSVTERSYEDISQVQGSFSKVMKNIEIILKENIPLKIKTQITRDNLEEVPKIKNFVEGLGLEFSPSHILYPRLNGDLKPCDLRITAQEALDLYGRGESGQQKATDKTRDPVCRLFPCAIDGGDGINVDPYGNMFLCTLIREPNFNLLKTEVDHARRELLSQVRDRSFISDSRCRRCGYRQSCTWCPGKAYAEKGSFEEPIEYYCELAGMAEKKK